MLTFRMEVAIKEAHAEETIEEMIEEAKTMIRVSKHDHIVNFQGICLHNEVVFLLLEFCALGPIKNFLQEHALEIRSKLRQNEYGEMIKWCAQIADGMEFLTNKNIIHVSTQLFKQYYSQNFMLTLQ